jgi:hypothetical protein
MPGWGAIICVIGALFGWLGGLLAAPPRYSHPRFAPRAHLSADPASTTKKRPAGKSDKAFQYLAMSGED